MFLGRPPTPMPLSTLDAQMAQILKTGRYDLKVSSSNISSVRRSMSWKHCSFSASVYPSPIRTTSMRLLDGPLPSMSLTSFLVAEDSAAADGDGVETVVHLARISAMAAVAFTANTVWTVPLCATRCQGAQRTEKQR